MSCAGLSCSHEGVVSLTIATRLRQGGRSTPSRGDLYPPIPLAPKSLRVIGHTLALLRDPWDFLTSLTRVDSTLVRIRLGPLSVVVVCDPAAAHRVLREDSLFDKGGPIFDAARSVTGETVVTAPHGRHRRLHRLVQPAFSRPRLPGYAAAMVAEIDAAVGCWVDGECIDVGSELLQITTRVFLTVMFSESLSPTQLDRAMADMGTIVDGLYQQTLMPPGLARLPLPGTLRYRRAWSNMRDVVSRISAERLASGVDHGDLLSSLLAMRDTESASDAGRLTDLEICNELVSFVLAGSESTAGTVAWALYLLSGNPEVLARLQTEADRVLGAEPVLYEQLDALVVTRHVLYETLRMYPPIWLLTRKVTADTELGGYRLRSGTAIVYSPYLLHRLEREFTDPERFDPDRWKAADAARSSAFMPFGAGPRRCLGDNFAMIEVTFALATIVRRWDIEAGDRDRVRPRLAVALQPRGLRLRIHARPLVDQGHSA